MNEQQHHEDALVEETVTIREAYRSLDQHLADQDDTFDVRTGLADLMARIDQESTALSTAERHVDLPDLSGHGSVRAARAAMRTERELIPLFGMAAMAVLAALTSVLIGLNQNSSPFAVGGLVLVNATAGASVILALRRSTNSTPAEELPIARSNQPSGRSARETVSVNKAGVVNVGSEDDHAQPIRSRSATSPARGGDSIRLARTVNTALVSLAAVGFAGFAALKEIYLPVTVISALAGIVLIAIGLVSFVSVLSRYEDRRRHALRVLMIMLDRRISPDENVTIRPKKRRGNQLERIVR